MSLMVNPPQEGDESYPLWKEEHDEGLASLRWVGAWVGAWVGTAWWAGWGVGDGSAGLGWAGLAGDWEMAGLDWLVWGVAGLGAGS